MFLKRDNRICFQFIDYCTVSTVNNLQSPEARAVSQEQSRAASRLKLGDDEYSGDRRDNNCLVAFLQGLYCVFLPPSHFIFRSLGRAAKSIGPLDLDHH